MLCLHPHVVNLSVLFIIDLKFQRISNLYGNTASRICLVLLKLRVNVSKDQSRCFRGSADLADFHIYCSVFHVDSHGVIRFS